jgi:hypothetical protein
MCAVYRGVKNQRNTFLYFSKIERNNPPLNLWIFDSIGCLNKSVSQIVTHDDAHCRHNGPLSLQLLAETTNK